MIRQHPGVSPWKPLSRLLIAVCERQKGVCRKVIPKEQVVTSVVHLKEQSAASDTTQQFIWETRATRLLRGTHRPVGSESRFPRF